MALDYLACGIDPSKTTIFIQSEISQLTELTFYYMNLVSVSRLQRNPTVKAEIKMRGFDASIPVGFQCYPISQAADITAFKATTVPAGEDQMPMIEQTQEIVHKFNSIYGETLVEPKILLPQNCACLRLPGRRPALGDDSQIAARRVAAAPPRTLRRDAELSDPPRDGPPPAHLARDAQRLGEPRPDPRPQDRRARAVPRQRCRSGTTPDCPHQKPIAMKTTSDCIGIREYLLRRGLQPHRETATHGMFLSPLRKERTPSFSVRYDKGLWYDFGLGEGGTLLQLVMRLEGCGMAEAIRRIEIIGVARSRFIGDVLTSQFFDSTQYGVCAASA